MPKILGLSPLGVLAASVAYYMVGFVWYGLVFQEAWMSAQGIAAADVEGQNPLYMAGGFLITIMQVIGLGLVLRWKGAADLGEAIKTALILWLFLALPFTMYAYLYLPAHSPTLLMIDSSHMLVGWLVSAAILSLLK